MQVLGVSGMGTSTGARAASPPWCPALVPPFGVNVVIGPCSLPLSKSVTQSTVHLPDCRLSSLGAVGGWVGGDPE